ncbi:MAG TPA: SusC/RagA family TonB-linked outer membrane protein [Porphyromonadaceae bacterium]|jgi:TonB-linked SusC/RagA family outer membrane protein|nr:SusC/RagA family TonB-linked outer membrane protein [Porphyromonadaceae bacterium]
MKNILIACLSLCLVIPAYAQQNLTVSGIVQEEKGEPLPGTSIYVKDRPGLGTLSDVEGRFTIRASKGEIIVFSFIGYDNLEYRVENEVKDLIIILKEKTTAIEEVVVTALGSVQRKISTVGAISSIDAQELQVPATSMANIIGGRMPGVITMQTSGEPGKNISEFWIRGISTFGANSSALVLIDGLEGNLNSIDPADVESFSILKDASATAVYGVRGANGVVLVNTKRGFTGKLKINARVNYTIAKLQKMPNYMHAYDYARLANEARVVREDEPLYTERDMQTIQYGLDKDLFPDVDWQKEIVNPVSYQKTYYLSAQGGGEIATYFFSLGMSNETAAYKQDKSSLYKVDMGYNTYSYRTNLDVNLTKTTKIFFGVDGYLTRNKMPGIATTNYIWQAQSNLTPLLIPTVYSTGHLPAWGAGNYYSPYVMINYTGITSDESNLAKATLALNQDLSFITKGLKIRAQGAFDTQSWFSERRYVLPELYYASSRDVNGKLQIAKKVNKIAANYGYGQNQYRKYHFESTLNYEKIIREDHRLSALVYYYMSDSKKTQDITGVDWNLAAAPKRYQGISSRMTYGYKDTYLLDVNFGYTGSENFQAGRRFGFFPSIAGGWVPTNYKWMKDHLSWLNFFKIRASHGSVGNDQISGTRFPYITRINENAPAGWGGTEGGIQETVIGADNLMWEKSIKSDIGIEGRLFHEKVSFVLDFFQDRRDGIFQQRAQIPNYVGLVNLPYGNVGKMKSWGSDGNISYTHDFRKDLSLTLRGNFTYSTNEIENWEQAYPKYNYQRYSNFPVNVIRGYIASGLFKDEQDVKSSPKQSFGGFKVMPGDIKYKDVNGDGQINTDDQVVLSYPTYPRLMYGFGADFRYKDLTVGILFKGTGDTDFFHVGYTYWDGYSWQTNGIGYTPFHGQEAGNVLTILADPKNHWTPASYSGDPATENPNARFPRLSYGYNANNSQLSTFWKGNSKYLRLQEITLNYNWKNKAFQALGLTSIDLQVVGNNLYVWDQVDLWDPEQAHQNGRAYPIPARLTFQVYLNF